jgi:hypothetical protein
VCSTVLFKITFSICTPGWNLLEIIKNSPLSQKVFKWLTLWKSTYLWVTGNIDNFSTFASLSNMFYAGSFGKIWLFSYEVASERIESTCSEGLLTGWKMPPAESILCG